MYRRRNGLPFVFRCLFAWRCGYVPPEQLRSQARLRVAARLPHKCSRACPDLSLTFHVFLQKAVFTKWAMLGSNQRPLPCEGSVIVCRGDIPANADLLEMMLCLRFQKIYPGCCAVAAHSWLAIGVIPGWVRWRPVLRRSRWIDARSPCGRRGLPLCRTARWRASLSRAASYRR